MHFIINNCLIATMVYLRVDNPYRNSGDAQTNLGFIFLWCVWQRVQILHPFQTGYSHPLNDFAGYINQARMQKNVRLDFLQFNVFLMNCSNIKDGTTSFVKCYRCLINLLLLAITSIISTVYDKGKPITINFSLIVNIFSLNVLVWRLARLYKLFWRMFNDFTFI